MGGFSTAYDLVSGEYGWTDAQIGELPLGRLRQITAAIQRRKFAANRAENSRVSWLARTLATYTAAGFQVSEGRENEALKSAQRLAIDDIERAVLEGNLEHLASKPRENNKGSFEKLMGFGGHMQAQGQ